jgi:hypothetical protein
MVTFQPTKLHKCAPSSGSLEALLALSIQQARWRRRRPLHDIGGEMPANLVEFTEVEELNVPEYKAAVKEMIQLNEKKKLIETRVTELRDIIGSMQMIAGIKSVAAFGYQVSVVESEGRKTLKKELLLMNGVDAETIAASTTMGDPYTTVSIKKLGGDENGSGAAK